MRLILVWVGCPRLSVIAALEHHRAPDMRKGLWWEHAVCVDQAEGGQKADEANQAVKLKARYDLPVEPRPAGVGPGIEQAVDQADKNIYQHEGRQKPRAAKEGGERPLNLQIEKANTDEGVADIELTPVAGQEDAEHQKNQAPSTEAPGSPREEAAKRQDDLHVNHPTIQSAKNPKRRVVQVPRQLVWEQLPHEEALEKEIILCDICIAKLGFGEAQHEANRQQLPRQRHAGHWQVAGPEARVQRQRLGKQQHQGASLEDHVVPHEPELSSDRQ
mmetsp:Transcript_62189/g.148294  ORF Transcript_62189/g.148294 Transcript_62189/m.148294 type:complete len:274 (+) Transcript_62189:1206-2027(+)